MAVKVADKLQQFNNGTYMLMDASAVEYKLANGGTTSVQQVLDNGLTGGTAISNQLSLVANSQYFKISITKNNPAWYGSLKFSYVYGTTLTEVDITITPTLNYTISKGSNTISSITYTIDGANITIGIKCTTTVYGTQIVEMPSEFGTINSLTKEEFTGDTTATLEERDSRGVITSLNALNLTADATVEDVVNALKNGESFLAPVNTFTNYETIFPNKIPNDQWNKIHIIKGTSLPNSHIRCYSQSGACEYLANVNNTNIVSWNDVSGTYIDISDSIIEKLGNEILKYPVGKYRINSTATGNKFTDLPSDVETKCGLIEINGTAVGKSPFTDTWVYRMYKFECLTGALSYVRRLNSGATAGQIELDTGWCKEGQGIYTSLSQLGLTAPITVGGIFNAMPNNTMAMIACEDTDTHITDVPTHYGVLTIKKNESGRFSIDYQISLQSSPCNVKRWIGTLKGSDGTGLYWKQLSAEPTFVTLNDIGLTANATFQDAIDKLPKGGSAILGVTEFANYQTIFPYEEGNDQFGRVHIVKGTEDGGRVYARWFRKDGIKEAIAIFNINDNKFSGWRILKNQQVYTTLTELGLDTTATINDIIGAMKDGTTFTYKTDVFDYATEYNNIQLGTVTINKQSIARVQALMTDKSTGNLYVGKLDGNNRIVGWTDVITKYSDPYICTSYKALTGTEDLFTLPCGHYVSTKINTAYNYPITDSSNVTAHIYVLGCLNEPANNKGYRIILYFDNKGRMYNINEWWGSFSNGWQKISCSEYHGIAQLNKARGTSIELVKGEDNTQKIMDALGVGDSFLSLFHNDSSMDRFGIPTSVGNRINRLHIEKILDANGSSSYCVATAFMNTGVVLNRTNYGGTLSAWVKTPSDARVTTLETQVSELFQSVSDGKKSVANAITGKGVSTSTTATFATMATNIGKITNYTASEKQALATAITNKGVSTSSTASFSTMATNISKIAQTITWKEETVSASPDSNTHIARFVFSDIVFGVRQMIAPGYHYQAEVTETKMFTINSNTVEVYLDSGTWKMTAMVRA